VIVVVRILCNIMEKLQVGGIIVKTLVVTKTGVLLCRGILCGHFEMNTSSVKPGA
jgi:hypothetical protein